MIGDLDPDNNIPAIERAARSGDRRALGALVGQLNSDDPAVRLYAIGALQRMTGQTFGYRYYDDEDARKASVERWQQWVAGQGPAVAKGSGT